jgi:hypothetical protein
MKQVTLTLIFHSLIFSLFTLAQNDNSIENIQTGTWRMHPTYYNAQSIAESEKRVYIASANGLFFYEKNDKNLGTISKIDGLSDIAFSKIAYHRALKILVITYQNGNIDLVKQDEIVNVRSILNARFENKQINHILLNGNLAYLSMPFGVVVLDLARDEVRETYANIGTNGTANQIFASAVAKDSLFLATEQGLLVSALAPTTNRLDFRNWRNLNTPQKNNIRNISSRNTSIFVGINGNDVFEYNNGIFKGLNIRKGSDYFDLNHHNGNVIICMDKQVSVLKSDNSIQNLSNAKIIRPRQGFLDANNKIWLADNTLGLVTDANGAFENLFPSGTYSPESFKLFYFDNKIVCLSGGYNDSYLPNNSLSGFYVFENGIWTNYNSLDRISGSVSIPALRDLTDITYNALEGKVFFTSFQDGVLEWSLKDNRFTTINSANSPLRTNRLTACKIDQTGDLWLAAHGVRLGEPSVYRRARSGAWQPFTFNTFAATNFLEMIVDDVENFWLRQSPDFGGGILVFDKQNTSRTLTTEPQQGRLNDLNVRTLANDKEGNMWIGTDAGIRVIFDAASVLDRNSIESSVVVFESRELLRNEKVTALKVDGGNRKWIGTEKGIWLFSADGSELISRFTSENSPLLSNQIVDIEIHEQTGEVFIATDRGLVSYRGTATEASNAFSTVRVFPNPVPPNFGGVITIDGLASNATIKITDVSGKLVYQTTANGGTATWNGTDYNSQRARTGVYYVFSANLDGSESFATKFVWVE